MSDTLTDESFEQLAGICKRFGLDIVAASRQGVMLTVTPRSLDALPDAETLRELADALGGEGIRYVTLDLVEGSLHD